MSRRVSPTERIRADIDELFAGEGDLGRTLEEVARLGVRLVLQAALEAEVTEFLGRDRYERRLGAQEARAGSRNGYADFTRDPTERFARLDPQRDLLAFTQRQSKLRPVPLARVNAAHAVQQTLHRLGRTTNRVRGLPEGLAGCDTTPDLEPFLARQPLTVHPARRCSVEHAGLAALDGYCLPAVRGNA